MTGRRRRVPPRRAYHGIIAGLETQLEEVKERGKQAIRVDVLVKDHALNQRQAAALHLILQQGELTIQDMEDRFPTLNRRTLQRDLTGLVGKGIIVVEGATNQLRYRLRQEM